MTKVNSRNEVKQNQTFLWDIFKSGHKILSHFNDFYNWHLSVSIS